MSESAEFILKLTDQVSGPAKQAAAALRSVDSKAEAAARRMGLAQVAAEKMNRQFDDARVKKAAKAVEEHARAADKAAAAARRMGLAQLQAQKINEALDKRKTFFGGLKAALPFRSVSDYAQGAFFGELAANAAMKIGGAFIDGAKAAVGFVTDGIKMAFVEGGKAENLRLSYKLLLGANGGAAALRDISGFSDRTKYDDDKIAEMMRPLFNAGLRGKAARSAFAASGDLEAAGLGPAQEFIDQFAKIQLKGGVSEKLLIGMGVNIRDFKAALAEETHTKDKEEAFKKASEGKSDPQAIMNAIFRGIEKRQGGQIGTGTEAAGKTMSARLEKLADLPSQYLKKMSESPEWNRLSNKLGDVLKGIDPDSPRGKKIIDSLFGVFNRLATWVSNTLTPENFDRFADGAALAVDVIGKIPAILAEVLQAVKDIGAAWLVLKGADFAMGLGKGPAIASAAAAPAEGALAKTLAGRVIGSGVGGVALAATQFEADKQGADMDAENERMVASGQRREIKHWYGSTYEDVPGGAPAVKSANDSRPIIVNMHGDMNITAAPGADVKETAAEWQKRTQDGFQKAMELASAHGGG